MSKKEPSIRENILIQTDTILKEEGIQGLNMRAVAQKCGIALGTIYNYFKNKDEILIALAAQFWRKALEHVFALDLSSKTYSQQISEIYQRLYKDFSVFQSDWLSIMRSINSTEKEEGLRKEEEMLQFLVQHLVTLLEQQNREWRCPFSKEEFANFICAHMLQALAANKTEIPVMLGIIDMIV